MPPRVDPALRDAPIAGTVLLEADVSFLARAFARATPAALLMSLVRRGRDGSAGWNLVSATCSDGSAVSSIGLSGGETVTCTFTNARERGAILITKTRKHAADGPGDHPHQGVTFTITGGNLPAGGATVTTNANGKACLDGLILSSFVGTYTVVETVPAGYQADSPGATRSAVQVTQKSTCGDGKEAKVRFSNTPLTDITVAVASQVAGGTRSSVSCVQGLAVVPGIYFSAYGGDWIRFSYALPVDKTLGAVRRLEEGLNGLVSP